MIKMTYYKKEENPDGTLKFTKIVEGPRVYITRTLTYTKLDSKDVPAGENNDPYTIIMGVGGREMKVQGSYRFDSSMEGVIAPGMAVKVTTGSDYVPEFGGTYWRIDSWTWDRDQQKLGKYQFDATLKYIWLIDGESMLYQAGPT